MLKKFLFGCCLAGCISTAQAQYYHLSTQVTGPSTYFGLPPWFGLPEVRGYTPFELSLEMRFANPFLDLSADRTDIFAITDIELVLTVDSGSYRIHTDGVMRARVDAEPGDPQLHRMRIEVEIGALTSYGVAGSFHQFAVFTAEELPINPLPLVDVGQISGAAANNGFLDVAYWYHGDEAGFVLGTGGGSLSSFNYAIAVPEPATCGMVLAGVALCALQRGRLRQGRNA